ncbi:MAG: PAS domain S-box protein [Syntrophales bacterium]|jgi:PAS domain S-box-containing protein
MSIERKTKKQLVDEMAELRRKVVSLEKIREQQESEITEIQQKKGQHFTGYKLPTYPLYVIFDRKYEFVNQTFEDLFGYETNEICHPKFDIMTVITPECRQAVEKTFIEGIRGNYKTYDFKFEGLKKDGMKIECDTSVLFIPYKWGTAIQGIIHNASVPKNIVRFDKRVRDSRVATGMYYS